MQDPTCDLTTLLRKINAREDRDAWSRLSRLVHDQLRLTAEQIMRNHRPNHTLQPSALVNEYWLRLLRTGKIGSEDRRQFYYAAAGAMRRILIDHNRRHMAKKRKVGIRHVQLDEGLVTATKNPGRPGAEDQLSNLEVIGKALERMKTETDLPRSASVFEWCIVLGKRTREVAEMLDISTKTVKRDLQFARAWLTRETERIAHR